VVVHRGAVALDDRRRLGLITLTSPARTIVDLAGVLDDEDLTAVVEDAIHRGLTPDDVAPRSEDLAHPARQGPAPRPPNPVRCGTTTYWIDCAFPQWRVAVEGFGDKFHRSPRNRKGELKRFADLATAHWRVLPVTWDEITDAPDDVIDKVMKTLAA
jgi:hypothetical protein